MKSIRTVFLVVLSGFIVLWLGAKSTAGEGAKLRVGVSYVVYQGGAKAIEIAREARESIVERLSQGGRVEVVNISPKQIINLKSELLKENVRLPKSLSSQIDILLVSGVWLHGEVLEIRLFFVLSDTGQVIKSVRVWEKKDVSIYKEIGEEAVKGIEEFLNLVESTAPSLTETVEKRRARGVGVVAIKDGNVLLAKRGALAVAQRDAVERALGATVELTVIPAENLRAIVAKLEAQIQNVKIITEMMEGELYIVEIEADVIIPQDVIKEYPAPVPPEPTGMKPAIQIFPQGSINWETGILTAKGYGKLTGNTPADVESAKRAGKVDAYASALEIISGINFDADTKTKEYLDAQPVRAYRLRGIVQGAEITDTRKMEDGTYEVSIRAPLWGMKGVSVVFSDLFSAQPAAKEEPLPEPEPGEENTTGLIIDARGLSLMPAMFPVVVDEDGNVVYGAGQVKPEVILQRGVAAYTTGEPAGSSSARVGPNPLKVEALGLSYPSLQVASSSQVLSWLPMRSSSFISRLFMLAQSAQTALRQGAQPVTVTALQASGQQKARVVVSSSSAAKIKRTNKKKNYLGEAKVVIITDSMVGATEGKMKFKNERKNTAKLF